jgi:hypothetical protein
MALRPHVLPGFVQEMCQDRGGIEDFVHERQVNRSLR